MPTTLVSEWLRLRRLLGLQLHLFGCGLQRAHDSRDLSDCCAFLGGWLQASVSSEASPATECRLLRSAVCFSPSLAGDHVAVFAENSPAVVEAAAKALGQPLSLCFQLAIPANDPHCLSEPFKGEWAGVGMCIPREEVCAVVGATAVLQPGQGEAELAVCAVASRANACADMPIPNHL